MNSSVPGLAPSPEVWICEITRWFAAGRGVPAQRPPEQTSPVVHALPSSHEDVLFVCAHPEAGLQLSSVHGLPSLQFAGAPAWQIPPVHVSPVVQAFPSLQGAELFACAQPVEVLQLSSVHGLPSLQFGGAPPWQTPAVHVSPVVQAFPSLQGAELFACTQPEAGLQLSSVHGLPSLQFAGAPAWQIPPVHASPVVQAFPSLQGAELFACTQPVEGLQLSSVQGLPASQVSGAPP